MSKDIIQLKVRIPRELNRRLRLYVATKHPDSPHGSLSKEVAKAIIYYLDSMEKPETCREEVVLHTHTHDKTKQFLANNNNNYNNAKFEKLVDKIREFSNPDKKTITTGLAKKAIKETIGMDERTIQKYLTLLHEKDILYGNSLGAIYEVQSWVFEDITI